MENVTQAESADFTAPTKSFHFLYGKQSVIYVIPHY